jgi:S1-C subfamily serine protease
MTGRDTEPDEDTPLERALAAVVSVHAFIPPDALTADVLGTERVGSGVIIREDGIAVTIGYLVTEAERIWLTLADKRVVAADVAGIDQPSGLAVLRILERGSKPAIPIGSARDVRLGAAVTMASGDGNRVSSRMIAKQEFCGYWEYRLDEALFIAPAHTHWGGAALISRTGKLVGIGSLHIPGAVVAGEATDLNMAVPIDLLKGVLDDLLRFGRTKAPARPWLGLYAQQDQDRLVVGGIVRRGPASAAGMKRGDKILSVANTEVRDLSAFYSAVWALGPAGVEVPLAIERQGRLQRVTIASGDRRDFLKQPTLH